MKSIVLKSFSLILFVAFFCCCQDLLVNDISDQEIEAYSPKDSISITTTNVTFWWESLDDATQYNIQVVSPSFNSIQKLWYDSIITTNKLELALTPGIFEWRIKAINDISETIFTTNTFQIDSTMNLNNQTLILYTPTNGAALNSDSITFRWSKLYNADNYKFLLTNHENKTILEQTLSDAQYNTTLPSDGIYQWSVSAHNTSSSTITYSSTIIIDKTNPENASLITPNNNSIEEGDSIYFQWTKNQDEGSEFIDSLIVAHNDDLTQRVISIQTMQNTYADTLSNGIYYWTIHRRDKAGNKSEKNHVYKFTKN